MTDTLAPVAAPVTVGQYRKAERELHKLYKTGSDLYLGVFGQNGDTVSEAVANKLARMHSTTLDALVSEGLLAYPTRLAESPRYGTAHVFEALGY